MVDLESLNKWLTLGANLGVLAGLLFLAVEIRQNNIELREARNLAIAEGHQAMQSSLDESYRSLANSDYLAEIFIKYETDGLAALSPEERQRFEWQLFSGMHRLDAFHAWYEQGFVSEDYYLVNFRDVVLDLAPSWREVGIWPVRPAFRAEVEKILAQ